MGRGQTPKLLEILQLGGSGAIQKQIDSGMFLKHRGRNLTGNGSLSCSGNRRGFTLIWYGADNVAAFKDLSHAHTDGLLRDLFQCGKPPFARLLLPTGLIQFDDQIGLLCLEIGRWIVEGQVCVFSNPNEGHIDGMLSEYLADSLALGSGISFATEEMELSHGDGQATDESLPQVQAKGGRVGERQVDVFVEMKTDDLLPVDRLGLCQAFQHFQLRSSRGYNNICVPLFPD